MKPIAIEVSLPSRDQIRLEAEVDDQGHLKNARLSGVGCLELLRLLGQWRAKLATQTSRPLAELEIPQGASHAEMLLREVLLKAQGRWNFPYQEEELCHCRAVATSKVDAAIIGGCHTVQAVRAATSANTSCGTCLPDLEKVLNYRLNGQKRI